FVPQALEDAGAEILFHRVQARPGRPLLAARLKDGRAFLGLPGNPASSAAGFRFFAAPLLRALQGLPPERPMHARLTHDMAGGGALTLFLRAQVQSGEDGALSATIVPERQSSFMVSPFAQSPFWAC